MLHSAGVEAQEVFNQFVFAHEDEKEDWEALRAKFRHYSKPRKNTV